MRKKAVNEYRTAIYCRSCDDGTDLKIQIQKEQFLLYCRKNGFIITDIYTDSTDSPNFKQMVDDISAEQVNCIISKDLSRLRRNFSIVAGYVDNFFPKHNVRYIALDNGIDTLFRTPFYKLSAERK